MRKPRTVLQMSQTDCAAACLAMISSAYGGPRALGFWQNALGSGRDGTSVARLVRTASAHGLAARAFALGEDLSGALRSAALPGVLHVDGNHFVVLVGVRGDRVLVIDPRVGRRRVTIAELRHRITGPLVLFTRSGRIGGEPEPRLRLGGVVRRSIRGLRLQFLVSTAIMVAATLAPAIMILFAVNHVLRPGRPDVSLTVVGATVACLGVQFLGTLLQSGLTLRLRARIDVRLMATFVRSLLAKDLLFLEQRAAGDVLSRIGSNTALRESLTSLLLSIGLYLPLTAIYASTMIVVSPYLTAVAMAGAAVQVAAVTMFGHRVETAQREALRADSELQIHSVDAVTNYAIVKAMGLEPGVEKRWLSTFSEAAARGLRRDSEIQWLQATIGLIQVAVPIAVVFAGAALASHRLVRLGNAFAMVSLAGIFLGALGRLATGLQGIYLLRSHLERLSDVIAEQRTAPSRPPVEAVPVGRADGPGGAEVQLESVSFRYNGDGEEVVRDVSLIIEPGELLGIGGSTGSGKTTLMHLLLGLYEPTAGLLISRRIGAADTGEGIGSIRYAYVPQDPELFSGTIRENVLAWRDGFSDRAVWEALERAALRADVEAMPLRLDTPVGSRGLHLSGGQRQRVALARAFLGSPDLLLCDEPTSHLDPATEQTVLRSIRALPCTRVIVAHSPRVLDICDRAVRIRAGRVVAAELGGPRSTEHERGAADRGAEQAGNDNRTTTGRVL